MGFHSVRRTPAGKDGEVTVSLGVPYLPQPSIVTPPDQAMLWRYMDLAKFVLLLESSALWFSRADQFEDPLEGRHTDADRVGWCNREEDMAKNPYLQPIIGIFSGFEAIGRNTFVNCWRESPSESMAMWDLYGHGSCVIAIRSTASRLKSQLDASLFDVILGRVKYVNWASNDPQQDLTLLAMRKDASYEHESEVRGIIRHFGLTDEQILATGLSLPIDLKELIVDIVISPRDAPWTNTVLSGLLKRYGLDVPITSSTRLQPRLRIFP
jgi:hypothetical protein